MKLRFQRRQGHKKFENMSDVEAAYLAALIDGEGCICMFKSGKSYALYVNVVMTASLPDELCEEWGGCFYHRKAPKDTYKPSNNWYIYSQERIIAFLLKIKPYLRVKGKQADLALEACAIFQEKPENYKEKLKELTKKMHDLNKKGPDERQLINTLRTLSTSDNASN